MKTFYTLLFTLLYFSVTAQIIITEISYNPPEAGTDSLEYIELYNASNQAFNLEGSSFSDGITHEFGIETIEAESYICLALNAEAMQNVFGKTCIQWTSGALKNGGELIRIVDSNGDELDAVEFLPGDPWPSSSEGTNGNGASIVLCDLQADNSLPESWSAAANDIGVEINGKSVKGSPGDDNTISCSITPDYTIEALPNNSFSPADITINPGETIQWVNSGGNHNINGDKSTFPDNPESFGNGAPSSSAWVYNHTFFIEGVYEYQCDPHSGLGMTGTITVGIPKTFPRYEIAVLRSVDANGVVDSLGKSCEIVGTVHGVNLSTSGGLLFFLIDENGDGISVYTQNNTLGYTVNEGDELTIRGTVGQFNGLTQFNAETVNVNGTGTIQAPVVVDSIYEANEAKLVKLENFTFVDEMEWRGDGSSFNIQVTNGEYTTTMRITEFTDLANMSAPQGPFNLIGLVNQYDFNEPYLEFYQLFPRSSADIEEVSSTTTVQYSNLKVSPNPTQGTLFIEGMEQPEHVQLIQMNGSILKTWNHPGNFLDLHVDNGVYILCVQKGSDKQYQKVIVTK